MNSTGPRSRRARLGFSDDQSRSARAIAHIDFHISGILETLHDASYEDFVATYALERTAERGISIISEAAKLLLPELRDAYPEIPWSEIIGIGNLLHEYEKIDAMIIWDIVRNHLPPMHATIRRIMADLEGGGRL